MEVKNVFCQSMTEGQQDILLYNIFFNNTVVPDLNLKILATVCWIGRTGKQRGVLQQHQTELLHIWGYFQAEPKVSQMLFPRLAKKI